MATGMATGIYKIEGPNDRVYIGSARCLEQRWAKHRADLARQKHHCVPLQRAYNKYGPDALTFRVIEFVAIGELLSREQAALDATPKARRYNTCPVAGSRLGDKATSQARANMRRAKANIPMETRKKIAASHKAAGIKPSREALMRGVAVRLARGVSAETRRKMSTNARRVHSAAERAKRSASKTHALTKANSSGVVGVHRHACGKWVARVKVGAVREYLGLFDTLEAAAAAITEKRT